MKKQLLISTIMRNQANDIPHWHRLLCQLHSLIQNEYEVGVSVYTNDNDDTTLEVLETLGRHRLPFANFTIGEESLGTKKYGSVWDMNRLKNLCYYRQQTINQVDMSKFDKVAIIESDVTYDPQWAKELILSRHIRDPHIYSGWSLRTDRHPKESMYLYDVTATRETSADLFWNIANESEVVNRTLEKTYINDIDSNCIHRVWSTFNCFCVYDAQPFKDGLKFDYINYRINTGQERIGDGYLDCDTSVTCENFRKMGYDRIYLNKNVIIRHK